MNLVLNYIYSNQQYSSPFCKNQHLFAGWSSLTGSNFLLHSTHPSALSELGRTGLLYLASLRHHHSHHPHHDHCSGAASDWLRCYAWLSDGQEKCWSYCWCRLSASVAGPGRCWRGAHSPQTETRWERGWGVDSYGMMRHLLMERLTSGAFRPNSRYVAITSSYFWPCKDSVISSLG